MCFEKEAKGSHRGMAAHEKTLEQPLYGYQIASAGADLALQGLGAHSTRVPTTERKITAN